MGDSFLGVRVSLSLHRAKIFSSKSETEEVYSRPHVVELRIIPELVWLIII